MRRRRGLMSPGEAAILLEWTAGMAPFIGGRYDAGRT